MKPVICSRCHTVPSDSSGPKFDIINVRRQPSRLRCNAALFVIARSVTVASDHTLTICTRDRGETCRHDRGSAGMVIRDLRCTGVVGPGLGFVSAAAVAATVGGAAATGATADGATAIGGSSAVGATAAATAASLTAAGGTLGDTAAAGGDTAT